MSQLINTARFTFLRAARTVRGDEAVLEELAPYIRDPDLKTEAERALLRAHMQRQGANPATIRGVLNEMLPFQQPEPSSNRTHSPAATPGRYAGCPGGGLRPRRAYGTDLPAEATRRDAACLISPPLS